MTPRVTTHAQVWKGEESCQLLPILTGSDALLSLVALPALSAGPACLTPTMPGTLVPWQVAVGTTELGSVKGRVIK